MGASAATFREFATPMALCRFRSTCTGISGIASLDAQEAAEEARENEECVNTHIRNFYRKHKGLRHIYTS